MSSSRNESFGDADHVEKEKGLMLNTMQVLDEEKENILSEVLRCYVCLELPKGKQVRICEEGHHCCLTCHKKIKFCGICRGRLLKGRNFVVEQLVNKLGPILGHPKNELPPPEPPKQLTPGSYPCLHQCNVKVPAFQMLPHLRSQHSASLLENVRSNPYSGNFSLNLSAIFLLNKKYVWSVQISDMGLFTVELSFLGLDLFGCVRMLADETISSLFRYQLVLKTGINEDSECSMEFSVTNCPVYSYLDETREIRNRGKCLKMKVRHLLEYAKLRSAVGVFVSIWEKREKPEAKERAAPALSGTVQERHGHFESNRKIHRNRNRNMRRKRLKTLRNSKAAEMAEVSLAAGVFKLTL